MKKAWSLIKKGLFGMHLWIPLSYSILFLVIALITSTIDGSWPFYFIGLSVSFLASLALTYYIAQRNEEKIFTAVEIPSEPAPQPDQKTLLQPLPTKKPATNHVGQAGYEDEATRIYEEQLRYSSAMRGSPNASVNTDGYSSRVGDYTRPTDPYAEALNRSVASQELYGTEEPTSNGYYGNRDPEANAHDALYSSFSDSASEDKSSFSPYVQPANAQTGTPTRGLDDYASPRAEEKPKIFRTRKEPNVLVYEYSDRYERYYLRSDGSLTRISTEPKY